MADELLPKLPARVRGRPFEKGRSGHPAGRRAGSRNRATLAAAALLEGESEALTRKAVELALDGDPTALRLCIERILPPCRERTVKFALPPIENAADISAAMQAVTSALAGGAITPGEAATVAAVVDTFVRAIETTKRREFAVDPLQILALGDYDETYDCDSERAGAPSRRVSTRRPHPYILWRTLGYRRSLALDIVPSVCPRDCLSACALEVERIDGHRRIGTEVGASRGVVG